MCAMMVDFAVLCMGLEQNNGIVTVVDFNTEKKVSIKELFYNTQVQQEYFLSNFMFASQRFSILICKTI